MIMRGCTVRSMYVRIRHECVPAHAPPSIDVFVLFAATCVCVCVSHASILAAALTVYANGSYTESDDMVAT